jgi:hypothetical protein
VIGLKRRGGGKEKERKDFCFRGGESESVYLYSTANRGRGAEARHRKCPLYPPLPPLGVGKKEGARWRIVLLVSKNENKNLSSFSFHHHRLQFQKGLNDYQQKMSGPPLGYPGAGKMWKVCLDVAFLVPALVVVLVVVVPLSLFF